MFSNLAIWHLLVIGLVFLVPLAVLAIGIPVSISQGAKRKAAGLVTTPAINTVALVGFILSFFFAPAAIVCGHIGRAQIRRSGESGWAMATWALFWGYFGTVLGLLYLAIVIGGTAMWGMPTMSWSTTL